MWHLSHPARGRRADRPASALDQHNSGPTALACCKRRDPIRPMSSHAPHSTPTLPTRLIDAACVLLGLTGAGLLIAHFAEPGGAHAATLLTAAAGTLALLSLLLAVR